MGVSLGDPDQPPSPWEEHADVLRDIDSEDRDPQLISVQRLCVLLEQHKREKAENNVEYADEVLHEAKAYYDSIVKRSDHFTPGVLAWLGNLKRELDDLLRQEESRNC